MSTQPRGRPSESANPARIARPCPQNRGVVLHSGALYTVVNNWIFDIPHCNAVGEVQNNIIDTMLF